jgi:hypothetical protein
LTGCSAGFGASDQSNQVGRGRLHSIDSTSTMLSCFTVNDRRLLSIVPRVMLIGPFDRNGHGGGTVGVRATGTTVAGDDSIDCNR